MSAEKISSTEEMVKAINNFINVSKKFITEKGYEKKLTEVMLTASDPDDVYIADQLVKVLSIINNMTIVLDYLNKPARVTGKIHVLKNEVWLGDTKLQGGDKIEYMKDGKWKAAIIRIEPTGGKMFLIGDDKSISDIHLINSTDGRMR